MNNNISHMMTPDIQQQSKQNQLLLNKLFEGSQVNGPVSGTPISQILKKANVQQQQTQQPQQSETEQDKDDIRTLVKDINRSLDDYEPSKSNSDEDEIETELDEPEENKNIKNNNLVPQFVKEGILITIIYVILSQEFVRTTVGKFVSYINPDETGKVHITGYISYGALLAILYLFFKSILI
jgi:hypothetical protein